MEKLVTGVHRFHQGYFNANRSLYERLANQGQRPETLFVTCADSRISPTHLTETEPGELFVIRNAGNLIPSYEEAQAGISGEAATLEYAVEVLGVRDIIVCGHTDCGAVKALLGPPPALARLSLVPRWFEQAQGLRELVDRNYAHLDEERRLTAAIGENVLRQLKTLKSYPFVRNRLEEGRLSLHGWVYHIGKGRIFAYDVGTEQFLSLEEAYTVPGVEPLDTGHRSACCCEVAAVLREVH